MRCIYNCALMYSGKAVFYHSDADVDIDKD